MGSWQSSEESPDLRRLIVTSTNIDEIKEHAGTFLERALTEYEQEQLQNVLSQRQEIGDTQCEQELGRLLDYFAVKQVQGENEVASILDLDTVIGIDEEDASMLDSPSPSSISVGLPQMRVPEPEPDSLFGGGTISAHAIRRMRQRLRVK